MFKKWDKRTPFVTKVVIILLCFICFIVSIVDWKEPKYPTVSVVMPTYNRSLLSARAIDSVLKQTYQDFELVVVDDASTDETQHMLRYYKKIYSDKIVVYRNAQNMGVSASRNIGNKIAKGKYIVILDSDDYFLPDFLEDAVNYMEDNPSIDIGIPLKAGYFEDKDNPLLVYPFGIKYDIYMFLNGNSLGNVGNIFKRDFIEKYGISYNTSYSCGEDYDFWVQMILKNAKIGSIEPANRSVIFRVGGGLSLTDECITTSRAIMDNIYNLIDYKPNKGRFFLCDATEKFLKKFPDAFDAVTMERLNERCGNPDQQFVAGYHDEWSDYLVINNEKTLLSRFEWPFDTADVLEFVPNQKLRIKWHRYGEEEFLYDQERDGYIFHGSK